MEKIKCILIVCFFLNAIMHFTLCAEETITKNYNESSIVTVPPDQPDTTRLVLESTTILKDVPLTKIFITIKPPDINETQKTEDIVTTEAAPTSDMNITKISNDVRMHENPVNITYKKPSSCSGKTLHDIQPIQSETSTIKKCCPLGETLQFSNDGNGTCEPETGYTFAINVTAVTFYNGCIEDNETAIELEIEAVNPCNSSVEYGEKYGDKIYVIQNGSLLIMDKGGYEWYGIFDDYCLDTDSETGELKAAVCINSLEIHISSSRTIINALCMLISIPCLVFVSFIHFAIKELRTLHGMCIGSLSWCLGIGFLLHSVCQLSDIAERKLQYVVQYFILAYILWLLVLCLNIVLFLWGYLLNYIEFKKTFHWIHFAIYSVFAMTLPLALVLYTKYKRIPGMPSYFYQGWSEYTVSAIRTAQRYFIPPVSIVLGLCFILLVVAYFGFRRLDEVLNTRNMVGYQLVYRNGCDDRCMPKLNQELAEEVKLNTKCISMMFIVVLCTWLLEVITFYSPGDYLAFLDVINALQGVFILIIFVVIRQKREIIASWWHDRGSHEISPLETEMTEIRKGNIEES